ncbi:MAG TPA: hypothetical protein DD856_07535 [Sulfobacillus sp.]|nr:hypothetical protein [Sulfobacillus sp.]
MGDIVLARRFLQFFAVPYGSRVINVNRFHTISTVSIA